MPIGSRSVLRSSRLKLTASLLAQGWAKQSVETHANFPDYPEVPLSLPTRIFTGDFNLQNGQVREFYLGLSHTVDDIFVYFPVEKVLYAGNILKEQVGNLAQADLPSYVRTLQRLKDLYLPVDYVVAGHWSPIHGPELVDTYLWPMPVAGVVGAKWPGVAMAEKQHAHAVKVTWTGNEGDGTASHQT